MVVAMCVSKSERDDLLKQVCLKSERERERERERGRRRMSYAVDELPV
jgi:hypothetical protein